MRAQHGHTGSILACSSITGKDSPGFSKSTNWLP